MMKTIKLISVSVLLLGIVFFGFAQNNDVPPEIISAIESGDAARISSFLNNNVELVVENKNDVYSKQQATSIITEFFRNKRVASFQVIHKGNKDSSIFFIGNMRTNSGVFRVYVLTRRNANQNLIQQLRIEPNNEW